MADDLTSTLTVAKQKALCVLNDLATSGKKSELLQRLLDSGLDREELGQSSLSVVINDDEAIDDEVVFSLEDDDTITPEVEPEVSEPIKQKPAEEILEAEILDADLVEISEKIEKPKK